MLHTLQNIQNLLRLLTIPAMIGFLVLLINGQSQTANQRGFNVGNSFAISDFETINTTNGNLMLRFPLAQLPSGRGGVTGGVFLTYQSKLFDTETKYLRNPAFQCQWVGKDPAYLVCPYYKMNELTVSDEGGWKLSTGYSLKFDNRRDEYDQMPPEQRPQCGGGTGPGYYTMTYVHKLFVIFPDGSQHEMVPDGHDDILDDRYYRVRYDGQIENCDGPTGMTGSGLNYYSVDGTYVRMSVSYDGNSNPNDNTWTLYFPDGSRYESSTGRGYDRNNNWIQYSPGAVSDQFGRSIAVSTEPATGDTLVTSNGFNGEPVVWRIKYKALAVTKKYNPWAEEACANGTCPPDPSPIAVNQQLVNVVSQLVLPAQAGSDLAYSFSYNAPDWTGSFPAGESTGFGELSGITLPDASAATGNVPAQIAYTYALDGSALPADDRYTRETLKNRIASKSVTHRDEYDGSVSVPITETWNYTISESGATITHPNGSQTSETFGRTSAPPGLSTSWDSGLGLSAVGPDGTLTERIWSQNFPGGCSGGGCQSGLFATNPYVKAEFTSIKSGGTYTLTAIKDYKYDKNGNVTEVREFDWIPYSTAHPGGVPTVPVSTTYLKRITKNEYYFPTPEASQNGLSDGNIYTSSNNPKLLRLIKSGEVHNGSGIQASRSEFCYDGTIPTPCPASPTLGNLTQSKLWDSFKDGVSRPYSNPLTSTNSISTTTAYNSCGMPTSSRDAKNIETTITYDTIGGSCGLYPVTTVTAAGTAVARTSSATFDFYTGLTTSIKDVDNSNATTTTSYDALGRPTSVTAPNGAKTQTVYNDTARYVITRSDVHAANDAKNVSTIFYDQLGRVRLAKTLELEESPTHSATDERHGIKIQTRYRTTSGLTCQLTSNPYRADFSTNENQATMGWTLSATTSNGLQSSVTTFSGTSLPTGCIYSGGDSTGTVTTSISGNSTTVTDQASKQRRSVTNALGQLVQVDEPDANGNLTLATNYAYDTLGNMITVQQGVQYRHFLYSSLERLLRVRQPEQDTNTSLALPGHPTNTLGWTAGFTYDDNGNVLTATDAKNITVTNHGYDALNRPDYRSYSDGVTPTVDFSYDEPGVSNSRGKLTRVNNGISETAYNGFDSLGRLLSSTQRTPLDGETIATANPRISSFIYNVSGAITKQTYPSGRTVDTEYEADGDILLIKGKPTIASPDQTYANNFSYFPDGKIASLRLGNNLWESAKLNSRLQATEIALGTSVGDGSLMNLNYEYGELSQDGNSVNTAANAGNIARQTITFSGQAAPFVQTYRYDSLDRITEAIEKVNGNTQTWKQTFGYDIYGNRNARYQIVGSNVLPINNVTLPSVVSTTNRFTSGQGYAYDANGNITGDVDAATGQSRTFTFNGDNKQTEVKNSSNITIGTYFYDGNGNRVKKVTDAETTIFVYDGLGKLVAEYSTATPPASPTINYTATDTLGSPRVITNGSGQVVSRRDFMPFGEELFADGTYRTTNAKYSTTGFDAVRQRFTGYQRDAETNLDFAEARYYQNAHGRFTAVDPLLASGKSDDPQTFNRYVYVMNNPLALIDPTGLQAGKWYQPKHPDGVTSPQWVKSNQIVPEGFVPVTPDRKGRLITATADPDIVTELNPNGPYQTPPIGIANMGSPEIVFGNGPIITDPWVRDGFREILSDAAEARSIEHPATEYSRGSEMAISPLEIGFLRLPRISLLGRSSSTAAEVPDAALRSRVTDIHGILDPIARTRYRTTAIVETREGVTLVASSRNTLSPAQRAALLPGEIAVQGAGHAEATALRAARRSGLTPCRVAASRTICPSCEELILTSGARPISP